MARVGRPTRLTKKVIDAICDAIECGANYADAACAAGVSSSVVSAWRDEGEKVAELVQAAESQIELTPAQWRVLNFWKRFTEAESQGAINCATVVYNAAMKDPQYALKWLERRRPKDCCRRSAPR
jgi:sulfur relay (sulfurtransferase) DsrC/TusE family protein